VLVAQQLLGLDNNFEARKLQALQEFFKRDAANVSWIEHAFARAKAVRAKAMVFAFQADVFESKSR